MFQPSKLGTQKYWDDFYLKESSNFDNNQEDLGEVWFDDAGAESRVIRYLEDEGMHARSVLDLGTGNGHMLFALREADFEGQMLGIDYSQPSINFAQKINEHNQSNVAFKQFDILQDEWQESAYDIVIDKGTLDAMILSGIPNVAERYFENVKPMINKESGIFVLTSCNFTSEELSKLATAHGYKYTELEYPTFTFGGQKGSSVVTFIMTL